MSAVQQGKEESGRVPDIKVDGRIVGPIGNNCFFLINETIKEGFLVDPGFEPERIEAMVKKDNARPVAILITHGHFDHINQARTVADALKVPIFAPAGDVSLYKDCHSNLSQMMGEQAVTLRPDRLLKNGEVLTLAGVKVHCLSTPGHTPGGMSYYVPQAKLVFTGDTLFYESVGRTDFPGGSMSQLVRSVKDVLFKLPDDTQVLPGHGELSDIAHEKESNPIV